MHIWDEPLNFIDVISRMQIEELLLEYSPTILLWNMTGNFAIMFQLKLLNYKTTKLPVRNGSLLLEEICGSDASFYVIYERTQI